MWASVARSAASAGVQASQARSRRSALKLVAQVAGGACAAACVARATFAEPAASDTLMTPRRAFQLVDIVDYPSGVDQAAELLATQWPSRGFSYRRQSLLTHCGSACRTERGALPTVLLLLDSDASNAVVAHCKVQSFPQPGSDGHRVAIMVSCIVHADYRNRGLGRLLVSHAEQTAVANGHAELYIWTLPEDGVKGFYASCGFEECQRPSYSPAYRQSLHTRQRNYSAAPRGAVWMRKSVVADC